MVKSEFAHRRKRLMQAMGEGSIAILPGAPQRLRNRDVEYRYRPDSDLYYLTGFAEPGVVMVLIPGRAHGEYIMFCRERDPELEIWNGHRAGLDGVITEYGADDAFPISDIDDILPGLLEGRERVFYIMGADAEFDRQVMEWINLLRRKSRAGVQTPGEFIALDHILHDMRLYKSAAEQRAMRRAATITADAHLRAMRVCRPGMWEYQLEAELLYHFTQNGAREPAYAPIVGSGKNGCILHYIENSSRLSDGDLVLIDAGGEYDYYAADITRTFPVNGRFSPVQRDLYELVLEAQHAAIEQVRPGNHWNAPHEAVLKVLTRGLVSLGLLKGKVSKLLGEQAYRRFYMHRTGHWLGMDVHDVGDYKVGGEWRILEPGMVLTVEPGLYISADEQGVAKKWRGIGIRIEDDVLVTRQGCEVLSADVPRTVAEIESVMAD